MESNSASKRSTPDGRIKLNAISLTRPKNAQERAYSYLKEQIVNLQLPPGRKLRAQEFAGILKLSRTPIREALGRLAQERLVHRDSGWGYTVVPMTFKEILDLFKIRESLEILAAMEALPNLTAEDLNLLKSIIDKSESQLKAGRHAEFRAASREFHMTIIALARVPLLHQILLGINDRIRLVAAMQVDVRRQRAAEILAENRRIWRALNRKDPRQVRAAILAHIHNARNGLLNRVGVAPSMFRFE